MKNALIIGVFLMAFSLSCKTRYERLINNDKLRAVRSDSSEAILNPETGDTITSGSFYYKNDSEKVLVNGRLRNGKRVGVWRYYFLEKLIEKRKYKNGMLNSVEFYTPRYW